MAKFGQYSRLIYDFNLLFHYSYLFIFIYIFVHLCPCTSKHAFYVTQTWDIQRTFLSECLLLPCGFPGSNSGHWTWWQVTLLTESSGRHFLYTLFIWKETCACNKIKKKPQNNSMDFIKIVTVERVMREFALARNFQL